MPLGHPSSAFAGSQYVKKSVRVANEVPRARTIYDISGVRVHWGRPLESRWKDEMRKGSTRRPQDEPATGGKNYITPGGLQRLKDEHRFLLTRERRAVTEVVAWAASNGDRSENADYQ